MRTQLAVKALNPSWLFVFFFDIWAIAQTTRTCEQTTSAPSASVRLPRRRNKKWAGCARGAPRSRRSGSGQALQRITDDALPAPKAWLPFVPESQDGSPNTEPSVCFAVVPSPLGPRTSASLIISRRPSLRRCLPNVRQT